MTKKVSLKKLGRRATDKTSVCITKNSSGRYDIVLENLRSIHPLCNVEFSVIRRWTRPGIERKAFEALDLSLTPDMFNPRGARFRFTCSLQRAMRLMGGVFVRDTETKRVTKPASRTKARRGAWMKKAGFIPRTQRRKIFASKQEQMREKLAAMTGGI